MSICAIVAVDENWAIGNEGQLLISIPEDLNLNFKVKTMGHPVIYGRKTLDTFPGRRLLPGRPNIILSRDRNLVVEGAQVMHSVEEVLAYTEQDHDETYFIIGGAQIYEQFLPYCEKCIVTRIHRSFEADAFFPNLFQTGEWTWTERSETVNSKKGVSFDIWTFERI